MSAYDEERLILIVLHSKGHSTKADFDANVADVERFGAAAHAKPDRVATLIVLAESTNPPDATQRKRIAEVQNRIPHLHIAFVTGSSVGHMVMTAINWLAPSRPGLLRTTHGNYEAAHDWLVGLGQYPSPVFRELYIEARRKVSPPG